MIAKIKQRKTKEGKRSGQQRTQNGKMTKKKTKEQKIIKEGNIRGRVRGWQGREDKAGGNNEEEEDNGKNIKMKTMEEAAN